jgi:deoxyribodipyrimidine photo-lyase
MALESEDPSKRDGASKFLAEIGWREFAHHLLYHFPTLPERNWRSNFDAYPWRNSTEDLKAWQRGLTGYPLVDAGRRELWQTGCMHNRVRMITASFLVKHLRIDWRQGETWFWDTLVDANLANNAAGWQWVAGSGADASPYFRIFNPMTQGRKFDPNGDYVRRWCPELARLPNQFIHAPFQAAPEVLARAGIKLGSRYPNPIVDHDQARKAALAGYDKVRAIPPLRLDPDFMIVAQLRGACCYGQAVIRAARSATAKRRGRPRKDSAPPQARCTHANRAKPSTPSERTERQCHPRESRPN